MADQNLISPSASSSTSPWWAEIFNQKPTSATAFNGISSSNNPNANPIGRPGDFGASINTQSNATPLGNLANPSASLPSSPAAQQAANSQASAPAQNNTGNIQSSFNASASNQAMNPMASAPQTAQPTQQQSSGSGLSSGVFQQAISGLKNQFSDVTSGITNSINQFGSGLGFAANANVTYPAAFGPAMEGSAGEAFGPGVAGSAGMDAGVGSGFLGSTATLSGTLGAAGLGYFGGGQLASLLGENQTGGSIGGAIGAAAGMAIGGPIGGLVGGTAGSVIGGLFGPGAPTSDSEFATNKINPDGTLDSRFATKNASTDAARIESSQLSNVMSGASSALGINFAPIDGGIGGGVNTLHSGDKSKPGFLTVGGQRFLFDPKDSGQTADAYYGALSAAATQSGYTDTKALYNWFYGQGPITDSTSISNSAFSGVTIAPKT